MCKMKDSIDHLEYSVPKQLIPCGDFDWVGNAISIYDIRKQLDEFESEGVSHIRISITKLSGVDFQKLRRETKREYSIRLSDFEKDKSEKDSKEANETLRLWMENEIPHFLK